MILRRKTVDTLRILATTTMLVLIGYYIYSNKSYFEILLTISRNNIIYLSILYVIIVYFSASQNALLIQSLGVPLQNLESFGLSNISALVGFILPQGSTITKAVYLRQRYSLPYSKSPAWFLGGLLVFMLIGSLIMFLTNIFATIQGIKVPQILWFGAFCGTSSGLFFFFDLPKGILRKFGKVGSLIGSFSDGWKELRSNKPYLIKACLWQIAIFISSGVYITIAYHSIGVDINLMLGISLSILNFFLTLIAIIPGNLGVQEAVYGYFSYLSGLTFVQGVVASTLVRAIGLLVTIALAPIAWYFLFYSQGIKIETTERD